FDQINEPLEGLIMQGTYANCLFALGEAAAAADALLAMKQRALGIKHPEAMARFQATQLGAYLLSGNHAALLREGPETLERLLKLGGRVLLYFGSLVLGQAMTQMGDLRVARAHLSRAAGLAQQVGEQMLLLDHLELAQAELLLAEGRFTDAIKQSER